MLSLVEHEKCFITLVPGLAGHYPAAVPAILFVLWATANLFKYFDF